MRRTGPQLNADYETLHKMTMAGVSVCVVVSGLPASGKSSLGRHLARELGLTFLDKDDFLERLFDASDSVGDQDWRQRLSTQSNREFERDATRLTSAVLVSHWRPPGVAGPSGTPTPWVLEHFDRVVELYCRCPVQTAVDRFMARRRHPGHNDGERTFDGLAQWFSQYESRLPLGLGSLVDVESHGPVDWNAVTAIVRDKLSRAST